MFYAALTPLLPHYADELGLSKAGAGVLAGSYAFGALVAGIPAGIVATRVGVKPTLLVGLGGMTVTTALFGLADSEWLLVTARFLQGAASSFSWTAGLAWLIADAPADSRGRLIGSAMGVAIFGAMLGPVIGAIASITSTEATFGGIALIGLGLAAWAAATSSQRKPSGQPVSKLFGALTERRMLASVWFVALPSISFGALGVLAPLQLHDLGLGAVAISGVWLVAVGFEATAAPLVGTISDRRGRLWPLRLGAVAAGICFVLFTVLDAHWATFAAGIVACSFALGAFWAPSMSLASDEADALGLDYAFGFAIINLAWAPSQVVGSAGGGRLADATSDAAVYLVLAALFLLTFALLWIRSRGWTRSPAMQSNPS
jgi:predicted MFS family arabinose efflux permease